MSTGRELPVGDNPVLRQSLRRWEWSGVVLFVLLVAAFPAYQGVETSRRDQALLDRQRALVTSGHQLWGLNCASCHGMQGEGVDAPALNSQEFLGSISDEQMHGIIAGGITGSEMPAWWNEYGGFLTDEQIAMIVAYIRSWEPDAPSRPDWRDVGSTGGTG